ncbi:vanadium-dependent haloperoxidase [Pelomonas sp. SE-A7]|uniref:vanadium-dependent haloperoxidase n=1 Tax=Pelomonas sp. SE-A7 TaxID=3054953 RepID=UPI00259CD773|nr:vanadium-dependent haloperoxidase [Pelomonas sp. SE-A7]MDM4767952.1 vanadium-dependent haloperoxidase [Pelomonas sp. SE-A7]
MKNPLRRRLVCALLLLTLALPVRAIDPGVVLDWAAQATASIEMLPASRQPRASAMVDLAVFNALNAIEPRYRGYGPPLEASPQALPEAAVAAAVWGVLSNEPQAEHSRLARAYQDAIARLPEGAARQAGIALGLRAAQQLIALRAEDGFEHVAGPQPAASSGLFQTIPGRGASAFRINKQPLNPLGVINIDRFEPGAPPSPESELAKRELVEAKTLGGRQSSSRTADQTAAALFWNSGPPGDEQQFIRGLLHAQPLPALETARLLALLSMSDFDSRLLGSRLKLKHQRWRPQTAIASEFTPAAQRDASWLPLLRTPVDPEYPSGYALWAGVLEALLPLVQPKALERFNSATGQTRQWASVQALAEEMGQSRIWGGVHFRSSIEAGRRLGRQVAEEILANQLQPLAR